MIAFCDSKKRPDLKGITTCEARPGKGFGNFKDSKKRPDLKGITTSINQIILPI